MGIIQAFIEKYNGIYQQEIKKGIHTPLGKYTSHPMSGKTFYKGNKIKVYINESGGAIPISELFRMKLFLDESFDSELPTIILEQKT